MMMVMVTARRIGLVAVMAALLLAGCGAADLLLPPVRTDITATQLQAMMNDGQALVILDVRTVQEYQEKHIPGSINIPVGELEQRMGELNPNARTVCVCRSGVRSAMAADMLVGAGFTRVYNLEEGLLT